MTASPHSGVLVYADERGLLFAAFLKAFVDTSSYKKLENLFIAPKGSRMHETTFVALPQKDTRIACLLNKNQRFY